MPKKLLLADDSITIQKVIGITLANEEFALTTVDNGTDAIATAKRLKPDLILADVVMPGKTGYEVCEYVKHDPELRNTPVMLLAGTFESFDEAEMARVGADGYITKPFESQTLIDTVHELISRAQSGQNARATLPAPAPTPASAAEELNLEDFSPFEEMAPADPAAPASGPPADEDAWDLSDFEPGAEAGASGLPAEGGDAGSDEMAFADAPAAMGADATTLEDEPLMMDEEQAEPAAGDVAGVGEEALFDFGEPDPTGLDMAGSAAAPEEDPFETGAAEEAAATFAGAAPAGDTDDVQELTDFEEVTEADDLPPESGEAAGAPFVPAGAAEGWEVAPVSDLRSGPRPVGRTPGQAPAGARSPAAGDVEVGTLAVPGSPGTRPLPGCPPDRGGRPGNSVARGGEAGAAGVPGEPKALRGGSGGREAARLPGVAAGGVHPAAERLATQAGAAGAGLSPDQVEAIVSRVAREVIEEVAWEVVPDLCEALIREEIRKITAGK